MYWTGFDAGREGLWKDPIWFDVIRIIEKHEGEDVYDSSSPIYADLETSHPGQAWRSQTSDGRFRPLFRDYPNSWTRTGVVSLEGKKFWLTTLGKKVLTKQFTKAAILANMFRNHTELTSPQGLEENPFEILAVAILAAKRPLSTEEIYWGIMKNYRPEIDDVNNSLRILKNINDVPEATPYRRLRNMLTLMRTAGALISTRRGPRTFWSQAESHLLHEISNSEGK